MKETALSRLVGRQPVGNIDDGGSFRRARQILVLIRDPADCSMPYNAIIEDVDIFRTGDKDFGEIELEKPQILTPGEFMSEYGWH